MSKEIKMIRNGVWVNEGGSHLYLNISRNKVEGFYLTKAARPEQKKFPVIGWINDEIIGFVVSFENTKSLTSWCGRYFIDDDGRECIKTVWHLGRKFQDADKTIENKHWETFISNSNTYYYTRELIPTDLEVDY